MNKTKCIVISGARTRTSWDPCTKRVAIANSHCACHRYCVPARCACICVVLMDVGFHCAAISLLSLLSLFRVDDDERCSAHVRNTHMNMRKWGRFKAKLTDRASFHLLALTCCGQVWRIRWRRLMRWWNRIYSTLSICCIRPWLFNYVSGFDIRLHSLSWLIWHIWQFRANLNTHFIRFASPIARHNCILIRSWPERRFYQFIQYGCGWLSNCSSTTFGAIAKRLKCVHERRRPLQQNT